MPLEVIFVETAVGQLKGSGGGAGPFVGVFYGCGQSGEATARPHLRIVCYREAHCLHLVKGALNGATGTDEFPEGHLFVKADGKTRGNLDRMNKVFTDTSGKALAKNKTNAVLHDDRGQRA